jgi:hypothetical protein
MSKSAQIVQAVCKYPTGQPRQGKYGEYISALFTTPECGVAEFVLDEDNLRCIATTIYIQTQRKFDL